MKTELRILTQIALAGCLASVAVSASYARTVKQKRQAARTQFETAERLRETLERRPETKRTRRDYQKVMEAYRTVYHIAPRSNQADAAVLAVAELLDEQGRVLDDPKSYKDAIGQLVFLRREYPGSKYRVEALFTIGEIFRDDLKDNADAKATFEDYLKHYPNSPRAPQARQALKEIVGWEAGGTSKKKSARVNQPSQHRAAGTKAASAEIAPPEFPEEQAASDREPSEEKAAWSDRAAASSGASDPATAPDQQDVGVSRPEKGQPHRIGRLTSVRHWSTPDYTRVAIDLEQDVKYQFGRVPHPDRIFFDLVDTKVAADLVGKSFAVEAGFLRRIRVSQYKPNMARVVLDVNDVAEYSAFLLPNPYRLIIDIHGRVPAHQVAAARAKMPAQERASAVAADRAPAPDVSVTQIRTPADEVSQPRPERTRLSAVAAEGTETTRALAEAPVLSPAAKNSADKVAASTLLKQEGGQSSLEKEKAGKTVETAKLDPPKPEGEDAVLDEPAKITSKPTSGPTFQAIAPQQSSRNRRMTVAPGKSAANATRIAAPTASGDRSLIRALGLKIGKIVVDAGHGGHDTGTVGATGLTEKDLVLDVALKLGKLLEKKLGAEVVYTRDDDTFIPLETRTAIANKEQADLFISIHANNSRDHAARGVETYYLNFTSSPDALEVAARENAVSEKSIHELQDLVKKIALKEKIEESREFAADVQHALYQGLNSKNPDVRNRGVKKAPFVVLIGANMPSILTEISFVSNPADEKKLKTSEYRQRIADSIYKGISKYISGLSGLKVASKLQDEESPSGAAAVAEK